MTFKPEVYKRFNRRRGGKIYGGGLPGKTEPKYNQNSTSTPPSTPNAYPAGSKYGPTRPMPDRRPTTDVPERNSKYDFTRKSGSAEDHGRLHENKTTDPRSTPTPPNSKFDPSNTPDKVLPRDKPPIKYPKPTTPPQTYPTGSKYGPNRPMPGRKDSYSSSPRGSRYDFTTKSGNKTITSDTLLRKLNRRRNGS